MKSKFFLIIIAVLAVNACTISPETSVAVDTKPIVMINATSDATTDPHMITMGMHLAQKSLKNDIPVMMFFNVHGVKIFKPGMDSLTFHNENLQALLKDIIANGGKVMACPHCMMVENIDKSMLPEGVVVAEEEVLVNSIKENPMVFNY